jgi:hypothetical protein
VSERETLSVVSVEGLDFQSAAIGLGEQGDAAVGHGAINIHEDNLDLSGALFEGR